MLQAEKRKQWDAAFKSLVAAASSSGGAAATAAPAPWALSVSRALRSLLFFWAPATIEPSDAPRLKQMLSVLLVAVRATKHDASYCSLALATQAASASASASSAQDCGSVAGPAWRLFSEEQWVWLVQVRKLARLLLALLARNDPVVRRAGLRWAGLCCASPCNWRAVPCFAVPCHAAGI